MTNYSMNMNGMNMNGFGGAFAAGNYGANSNKGTAMPFMNDLGVQPSMFGDEFAEKVRDVKKHLELTKQFVASVVGGVHKNALLQGPPGLGKSHVVSEVLP